MSLLAKKPIKIIEIIAIAVVVILDQLSKTIIVDISGILPKKITWFFDLVFTVNYGVSFGLFSSQSSFGRIALSVLTIAITIFILRLLSFEPKKWSRIAYALIIGGAIGNLLDRFLIGGVVDFLSVHYDNYYFPAFNVADMAITCGAIWLILSSVFFSSNNSSKAD